jgi:hypothetical protein
MLGGALELLLLLLLLRGHAAPQQHPSQGWSGGVAVSGAQAKPTMRSVAVCLLALRKHGCRGPRSKLLLLWGRLCGSAGIQPLQCFLWRH